MKINRHKKSSLVGFTLVEMLVTVTIASLAIVFFSQLFIDDMQRKQWDLSVNDLITLNRVVSLYYIDNEGLWPGEIDQLDGRCSNREYVAAALQSYIPAFDSQYFNVGTGSDDYRFEFDCNEREFTITTRFLNNSESAAYIASGLPIARVSGDEVVMHIIKPRMQYATNVTRLSRQINSGDSYVDFSQSVISCANKEISVQPLDVCVGDQQNLGGYRVDVTTVGDNWRVTVLARTDAENARFQAISSCSNGSSEEPITVQALVFCQD